MGGVARADPACQNHHGMMDPGPDTIKRAAELVKKRREQLGRSQDLTEYGGPSRWVLTELELKNRWPARPATQMEIARALNWQEDAFDLLARGETPIETTDGGVSADELRNLVNAARESLNAACKSLDEARESLDEARESLDELERRLG